MSPALGMELAAAGPEAEAELAGVKLELCEAHSEWQTQCEVPGHLQLERLTGCMQVP